MSLVPALNHGLQQPIQILPSLLVCLGILAIDERIDSFCFRVAVFISFLSLLIGPVPWPIVRSNVWGGRVGHDAQASTLGRVVKPVKPEAEPSAT